MDFRNRLKMLIITLHTNKNEWNNLFSTLKGFLLSTKY